MALVPLAWLCRDSGEYQAGRVLRCDQKPCWSRRAWGAWFEAIGPITDWLGGLGYDGPIVEKGAIQELAKLVKHRLGYGFVENDLTKSRTGLQRYLLINEFRADLKGAIPSDLASIPTSDTKEQMDRLKAMVARLRHELPEVYTAMADSVERELDLAQMGLDPQNLGSLDTFRFEEKALFAWCTELLVKEQYLQAQTLIDERRNSFWLSPARRNQWEACNRIITIGLEYPKSLFGETLRVRPVLVAKGQVVGEAGMVDRATLDRATGCVSFEPGANPTVAMLLNDAEVSTIQIQVLDPKTDSILAKSGDIPIKLGI